MGKPGQRAADILSLQHQPRRCGSRASGRTSKEPIANGDGPTVSTCGVHRGTVAAASDWGARWARARLGSVRPLKKVDPVMLPPGRARLSTIPIATASPLTIMTIGVVVV